MAHALSPRQTDLVSSAHDELQEAGFTALESLAPSHVLSLLAGLFQTFQAAPETQPKKWSSSHQGLCQAMSSCGWE